MVVELISKTSSDEGSTPSISTLLCRQWSLIRRVSAGFSGMIGFDGLQVWIKEIMAASKWQINQHVSATVKSCRLNGLLQGGLVPLLFNFRIMYV